MTKAKRGLVISKDNDRIELLQKFKVPLPFIVYPVWELHGQDFINVVYGEPFESLEKAEEHMNSKLKKKKGRYVILQIHSLAHSSREITNKDEAEKRTYATFTYIKGIVGFQFLGTIKAYDREEAIELLNDMSFWSVSVYELRKGVIPEKHWLKIHRASTFIQEISVDPCYTKAEFQKVSLESLSPYERLE